MYLSARRRQGGGFIAQGLQFHISIYKPTDQTGNGHDPFNMTKQDTTTCSLYRSCSDIQGSGAQISEGAGLSGV